MRVAVISDADSLKRRELLAAIEAVNIQVKKHFIPAWRPHHKLLGDCLNLIPKRSSAKTLSDYDAIMYIKDRPRKSDGTLGYHDKVPSTGKPFGYVFASVAEQLGESFSTTLSHEVLELLLNPWVCNYALGPSPDNPRRTVFHWFEACDAVQASSYEVKIKSGELIEVSDFLRPLYFTVEHEGRGKTPNNFLNSPSLQSFGVMPGGYVGYYDPDKGDKTFFANTESERRYRIKQKIGSMRRIERLRKSIKFPKVKAA